MIRCTPRSTRPYPLFPYTTLFRSTRFSASAHEALVDLDLVEWCIAQITERAVAGAEVVERQPHPKFPQPGEDGLRTPIVADKDRTEEHTSELQSLMRISYAVFCLKKKNKKLSLKI